ncbi:MAG: hypothetical protein HY364_00650 [Candidatus Aenigmarchaeota archaeon]|nr:hypothetical protein [Candidatus Aenigmarchaeota archaeon]
MPQQTLAPQQKQKWKNCPKCEGWIPKSWQRHTKCGWSAEEQPEQQPQPQGAETTKIDPTIAEFADVYSKCKTAIESIYATTALLPEHIAAVNTLFIQVAREKHFHSLTHERS